MGFHQETKAGRAARISAAMKEAQALCVHVSPESVLSDELIAE